MSKPLPLTFVELSLRLLNMYFTTDHSF